MFDGYLVTLAFNSLTVLIGMLYTNKVGSLLSNIISYGVLLLMGGNIIFSFMGSKYAESKPLRMLIEMLPNVQVDIVVSKVPVRTVIETAKRVLYTGHIGDGKIFVYDVENVVKVRTGEEGFDALQDVE